MVKERTVDAFNTDGYIGVSISHNKAKHSRLC